MSLVLLADAQARAGDSITQDMIDGVEDWLAAQIGPLTGERTETFFLSERRNLDIVDGLWLSRRTDSVELTNDGTDLVVEDDFRLIGGILVLRTPLGTSWLNTIVATYTPTDEMTVTEGIIKLLTYSTLPSNIQSVRIGAYSETFATGSQLKAPVTSVIASIKPAALLGRYASPFRYRRHREDRTLVEAVPS